MKRKMIAISLAALLLCLCGCENTAEKPPVPNQMVSRIEVFAEPVDESMTRSYTAQTHLSPIIRMLRELDPGTAPEMNPLQSGEHVSYTVTVTYSGGSTKRYTILDNRYFRTGDGDWTEPPYEQLTELIAFIRDNPNE